MTSNLTPTLARAACAAAVLFIGLAAGRVHGQPSPSHRQLLLIVDGLRPDYVTPEVMPRLTALGRRGVVFTAHHSVFPTVTRVNASSLSTGAYPEAHGLMGNTVFSDKVYADRGLNTSDADQLLLMEKAEGRLQTAPTIGAALQRAGMTFVVFSAGSSGSALLLNHPVYDGAVINPEFIDPPSLAPQVLESVGVGPKEAEPNIARNVWAVSAYLSLGLNVLKPQVAAIWFGDPDATAHRDGVGTPMTVIALKAVDAEIGRIEDTLGSRGLLATTNIIVVSDHGFSTHTGTLQLGPVVSGSSRAAADGTRDLVVTEGAVNFRGPVEQARVAEIVAALQKRPEVGAIFTRPAADGSMRGVVPGTLSFNVARWNHARAAEILVSGNWTDQKNGAGFPGTTTQTGTAGHGTSSPFDIHNTLIAAGPDFRERATSSVPTSNVDLAPTLLRLLNLPVPETMTGRPILEALITGPAIDAVPVTHLTERATSADGSYEVIAHISTAAGRRYLDDTEVRRPAR
ncbi:MAG TPA: alkaline phosphatase family protein [Vicinamibacterales bacterium]|nr:alkaline phosphatase family protein [Vicinamibacterales bacterium]